ncbi:DUF3179 domain-containing (seleno)protein [Flavihumibacter profundi]|uniref:DUF3179 domain-containing (seleno)protein n=1 Tax=Flavihumibacter profundi TaxID=2716883 RepID=UPI001CC35388|nr:DUF3179 domain-containing (seleno)protein [Flavihumibacter profundi]MBZ5859283.1 DUF3179 domain-containing protein [Flavihumibacter profundi]
MYRLGLGIVLLILVLLEAAGVYFIMPFPGSQQQNSIPVAYWLHNNTNWIRGMLLLVTAFLSFQIFKAATKRQKIWTVLGIVFYIFIFYMINFQMQADKMFHQPSNLILADVTKNKVAGEKLVLGVSLNGIAKAYPIQYIGYHHQVRDSLGNTPIMVTYCTVCRTGRVFSPVVQGQVENFRLVGMDHFNAMFEDARTKSWWRQATGEAVEGPLKGNSLVEIPSQQMRLSAWLRMYPNSMVMQPDKDFIEEYGNMVNYETGLGKSELTRRDSLSWKEKSWILGIRSATAAKAYDWNELVKKRMITDSIQDLPVLLVLEKDSVTFHGWDRTVHGKAMDFKWSGIPDQMTDLQTNSTWNMDGWCIDGALKGAFLNRIPVYQEFWHSWRTFHPKTTQYKSE